MYVCIIANKNSITKLMIQVKTERFFFSESLQINFVACFLGTFFRVKTLPLNLDKTVFP